MSSVTRFYVFVCLLFLLSSLDDSCSCCRDFSVYKYISSYVLLLSCLCEAWCMYYFSRRKNDLLKYQYALFFYMIYFFIYFITTYREWLREYDEFMYWIEDLF